MWVFLDCSCIKFKCLYSIIAFHWLPSGIHNIVSFCYKQRISVTKAEMSNKPVQDILSESMTSVGLASSLGLGESKCYQDKNASSSCASLPVFRSKIPVPSRESPPKLAPKPQLSLAPTGKKEFHKFTIPFLSCLKGRLFWQALSCSDATVTCTWLWFKTDFYHAFKGSKPLLKLC